MKILPSDLCTDLEFLRRVSLDLTGLPPTPETVRSFLDDKRPARVKRDELVDKLVGSPDFVEHWTNKWADLLQVNRKFLGPVGAKMLREWIQKEVKDNTPYDAFARKILTASGSNKENPPASYYKVLRKPAETMENTTHLFGDPVQLQQMSRPPLRKVDSGSILRNGGVLCPIQVGKGSRIGQKRNWKNRRRTRQTSL